MSEPVDLGAELAGYTGEAPPPRPRNPADGIFRSDPQYLGDWLQNQTIVGLAGTPPALPALPALPPLVAGVDMVPGQPPPSIQFDGDGLFIVDQHGNRMDFNFTCPQCGNPHPRTVHATNTDPQWVCQDCHERNQT